MTADILGTIKAELAETKKSLHSAFPGNAVAEDLARQLRFWAYQAGGWPTIAEVRAKYGERAKPMEQRRLASRKPAAT
jgi:hypothetical protein